MIKIFKILFFSREFTCHLVIEIKWVKPVTFETPTLAKRFCRSATLPLDKAWFIRHIRARLILFKPLTYSNLCRKFQKSHFENHSLYQFFLYRWLVMNRQISLVNYVATKSISHSNLWKSMKANQELVRKDFERRDGPAIYGHLLRLTALRVTGQAGLAPATIRVRHQVSQFAPCGSALRNKVNNPVRNFIQYEWKILGKD